MAVGQDKDIIAVDAGNGDLRPTAPGVFDGLIAPAAHAPSHNDGTDDMPVRNTNSPTYTKLKELIDNTGSAGKISGGAISDNGNGTVAVAAGTGMIKSTDSDLGQTYFCDWAAVNPLALTDNSFNHIYVRWNGGSPDVQVTTDESTISGHDEFELGHVYRRGTAIRIAAHGPNLEDSIHHLNDRFHAFGHTRTSGLVLSETGTRNIAMTAGKLWTELIELAFAAIDTDPGGAADTFTYWYNVAGVLTPSTGENQIDNAQYDDGTDLAALTGNRYGVFWVYLCECGPLDVVYGLGNYKLTEAQGATPPPLPPEIQSMGTLVAKIIIQRNAATFLELQSAWDQVLGFSEVTSHADLGELQGGVAEQYYHLTAAQHTQTIILDKLDATVPPTVNDDVDLGYSVGSLWYDVTNDKAYTCVDATDGAAVWIDISGGAHDLGGAQHNADTLANLNTKVSDATLDDSGDPRDPNAHAPDHTDGTDQVDNVFGGAAAKTITAIGTAQVDTAQAKFGTGSALLDGNSDSLRADDDPDWAYGTNNFTIEMWVRFNALPANGAAMQFYSQTIDNNQFTQAYIFNNAGTYQMTFYSYDGAEIALLTGNIPAIAVDTWYHLAVVRDGNEWDNYFDGTSLVNITSANAIPDFATQVYFGQRTQGDSYIDGWLDEIRISSAARYPTGSGFTPPTAPFVSDAYALILVHMGGADASTTFTDSAGGALSGLMTGADKSKLDGLGSAADAVSADANLTDDMAVRGKGGAKGVQTSLIGMTDAGMITVPDAQGLTANTADASDDQSTVVAGGGAWGNTRGAYIQFYGNEHAGEPGGMLIHAGNVAGAYVRILSQGNIKFEVKQDGSVVLADGAELASSAAPMADADIANKKYVDDTAGGTPTKEFLVIPREPVGGLASVADVGQYRVHTLTSTGVNHWVFLIPGDFSNLTEAVAIVIPDATETIQWDMECAVAALGNNYNDDVTTVLNSTLAVTINDITELDISAALVNAAADDYVGLVFLSDTSNIRIAALRIKYT